jgi:uncharacterized protein YdeI (YjbR/CyaY-like superfamily)
MDPRPGDPVEPFATPSKRNRERVAKLTAEGRMQPNRFAILYRVHEAKKPETRARRIEKFVAMLANGETLYP